MFVWEGGVCGGGGGEGAHICVYNSNELILCLALTRISIFIEELFSLT